jgi:RNA polymerase sigma factor (sigma-70 family)
MRDQPGASSQVDLGLDQIFTTCRPLVARVCRSRLSGLPAADIEDAIQETFLQLTAADRTRIVNIEAWLITVSLRVSAHVLRQRYRRPEVPLADIPPSDSVAEAIDHTTEQMWLARVASLMPKADMRILHMLYVQDLPYGEVAKYFHVSNEHARVLAYRARQHARAVIDGLQ